MRFLRAEFRVITPLLHKDRFISGHYFYRYLNHRTNALGVIVDAANDPSNDAFALPAMQRGIDCRTSSQIGKIRLGEGPPPPIAIDPAKYLLLNGLLHSDTPVPARKNTTFFLQDKGAGGGRDRADQHPSAARWYIYQRAADGC